MLRATNRLRSQNGRFVWFTALFVFGSAQGLRFRARLAAQRRRTVKQNGRFVQSRSAFVCRLKHSKARACAEMPCGAVSRPAGRVADAQRRASAKLPAAEKVGAPCKIFGFPQLFQHPPAPRSRGGHRSPLGNEKRAPSQAWKLFFSRTAPTNARPRKRGCLGRRSGFT